MKTSLSPTLICDDHGGWEIALPTQVLPRPLQALVVTEEGLYVETAGGYDFISYEDIATMVAPARMGDWAPINAAAFDQLRRTPGVRAA